MDFFTVLLTKNSNQEQYFTKLLNDNLQHLMCIDGTDEQDWFQPIEIYLIDLNENQFDLQYIRTSQKL